MQEKEVQKGAKREGTKKQKKGARKDAVWEVILTSHLPGVVKKWGGKGWGGACRRPKVFYYQRQITHKWRS